MLGIIIGLGTLTLGMYILLQSQVPVKIPKLGTKGVTEKRVRQRETKQLVLTEDNDKRYKFPGKGLTPGRAFQDLVIDNSQVPLVISSADDTHDRFGILRVGYELPNLDNWQ